MTHDEFMVIDEFFFGC